MDEARRLVAAPPSMAPWHVVWALGLSLALAVVSSDLAESGPSDPHRYTNLKSPHAEVR